MGFSRQEYWRGLPFPCPGQGIDLDYCGMEWFALEMKFERKTQSLKDQAKVPISYSKNLNCKGFVVGIGPLYREKTKMEYSKKNVAV